MRLLGALAVGLIAGSGSLLFAPSAEAARIGTVDIEGTEMYDGPGRGFRLIDKLPKGVQVATSNLPTEGFFKVRTSSGIVGWVSAESLILSDSGAGMDMPPPLPQQGLPPPMPGDGPAPQPMMPGPASTAPDFRSQKQKNFVRVRLLGGVTFFNAQELNDRLNFDALNTGAHFGGEIGFMFTSDLAMIVRVEHLFKNLVAEDAPTNKTFQFDLTSFPVMVASIRGRSGIGHSPWLSITCTRSSSRRSFHASSVAGGDQLKSSFNVFGLPSRRSLGLSWMRPNRGDAPESATADTCNA